jgi:TIR domain/Effector-associated domain 11
MKDQIQQLIADGNLEGALELLAQHVGNDAVLLQARYNQAKKQQNMGMIDYGEWSRVQAQINYAALDLAGKVKEGGSKDSVPGNPIANPQNVAENNGKTRKTFISYNHNDKETANKIVQYLTQNNIQVAIDSNEMAPGQPIEDFIFDQIKANGYIISLVSKNSLKSGWVGLESNLALFARLLKETKFIPVMIDNAIFDDDFFFDVADELTQKITDLDAKIDRAKKAHLGYGQFENTRERTIEHRQNLSKIIEHFQGVLVVDISGDKFPLSMEKVLKVIQS